MQKTSLDLLKRKLRRYPHLNELEIFLQRIENENPELLMLFGSLARGNYTQNSDIDILCIFNQEFKTPEERFLKAYRHSDGIVQTKTLSLNEFRSGLEQGNSFLHKIVEEGYILYSKIPDNDLNIWITSGKAHQKVIYYAPY
jgi:predicted nucleotidyltransferase